MLAHYYLFIVKRVEINLFPFKVSTHWMKLIHDTLGEDERKPVLIVANKSDKPDQSENIDKMVPIMNEFGEIETVVECSAMAKKNVSEVFFYAQRAVVYPLAPLYDVSRRELTPKCKKALVRIFKVSNYYSINYYILLFFNKVVFLVIR